MGGGNLTISQTSLKVLKLCVDSVDPSGDIFICLSIHSINMYPLIAVTIVPGTE